MDVQPNLLTIVGGYLLPAVDWAISNYLQLLIVIILLTVLWAMVAVIRKKRGRVRLLRMRAERMTPQEKAQHLKKIVGQGIHDSLFEAWHNGEINADDYQRECRRYGNIFDLSDLLPKQQKLLKARLKERIKQLRMSQKPDIPGPPEPSKNTEADKATVGKVSSFMNSFLSWRKAS